MPMTHIVIIRQCSCSKICEVLQILHADDDYIILFKVCNTKNTHNLHVLHAAYIGPCKKIYSILDLTDIVNLLYNQFH